MSKKKNPSPSSETDNAVDTPSETTTIVESAPTLPAVALPGDKLAEALEERHQELDKRGPPRLPEHQRIPLTQITESKTNPRKSWDKVQLEQLTQSIRDYGVLEPIIVRPLDADGEQFEIVAGARRFRAAGQADLTHIPCMVHDYNDQEALEVQVIENLQRNDLSAVEEAQGYRRLMKDFKYTAEALSLKIHKSVAYVYGRLKLLDLPKGALKMLEDGELDASRALLIARIPAAKVAEAAAKEIAGLSFREAKAVVEGEYMLRLNQAVFPTGDEKLVPAAGSCATCPKRTGNDRTLFGDVENEDLCTDSKCFGGKVAAFNKRREDAVKEAGGTVIKGEKASDAVYGSKFVQLDAHCHADGKQRTYRQILGKEVETLKPVLVEHPHEDRMVDMAATADVERLLKARGIGARSKSKATSSPATVRATKSERAHKTRLAAAKLALPDLREKAQHVAEKDLLVFVLDRLAASYQTRDVLKEAKLGCGYDGLTKAGLAEVKKLAVGRLRALVIECLLGERASSVYPSNYTADWRAACDLVGLKMRGYENQPKTVKVVTAAAIAKALKVAPPKPKKVVDGAAFAKALNKFKGKAREQLLTGKFPKAKAKKPGAKKSKK